MTEIFRYQVLKFLVLKPPRHLRIFAIPLCSLFKNPTSKLSAQTTTTSLRKSVERVRQICFRLAYTTLCYTITTLHHLLLLRVISPWISHLCKTLSRICKTTHECTLWSMRWNLCFLNTAFLDGHIIVPHWCVEQKMADVLQFTAFFPLH